MENITLTKNQLRSALLIWEKARRSGATLSKDETAAKPVETVADESTEYLWGVLAKVATKEGSNAGR